jgi:Schlafen, AlbA_2
MVAFRSRRIESLFGVPLEDVEQEHICALVSGQIAEAFDLDFKSELYGGSESEKHKLATHIAALANTAGGLLVFGVAEDDQARAVSAPGVSVAEAEIRRIRQVAASLVVPLPVFDVLSIEDPATPGHGFLIVAVTRSPFAPHAVLVNEGFRFPRRNGATTRYLSEPEVATAYRQRFADAQGQAGRVRRIEREALGRLFSDRHACWVVVSLVPDVPGELLINQAALRAVQDELVNASPMVLPLSLSWANVIVGRGCLFASDTKRATYSQQIAATLYPDGAGVFALNACDTHKPTQGSGSGARWLHDEKAVNGILTGLRFLSRHARERAAAGGNGLVRVHLDPQPSDHPFLLSNGGKDIPGTPTTRSISGPVRAAGCTARLESLAFDGPDLVAAAYLLASELFQTFGWPEAPQLTRDGQVRLPYWSGQWHSLIQRWAGEAGIKVSDETLPV